MEISYSNGDFVLRIGADQMLSLRYALGVGVERLESDAHFFACVERDPAGNDFAASAVETHARAQAVRDEIERLMHDAFGPLIEWPHDGSACGPAGGRCLCMR